MANKFEVSSTEFNIPKTAKNQENEETEYFEYITYSDDPSEYVSKEEVSADAEKMIKAFKKKKIGAGTFHFFKHVA